MTIWCKLFGAGLRVPPVVETVAGILEERHAIFEGQLIPRGVDTRSGRERGFGLFRAGQQATGCGELEMGHVEAAAGVLFTSMHDLTRSMAFAVVSQLSKSQA